MIVTYYTVVLLNCKELEYIESKNDVESGDKCKSIISNSLLVW